MLPVRIEPFIEGARRIWLVQSSWEPFAYDPGADLPVWWLDGHAFRELRQPFYGLTVYRYGLEPAIDAFVKECRLADLGDWQWPHYLFPDTPDGQRVEQGWLEGFVQCLDQSLENEPETWGVRFAIERNAERADNILFPGLALSASFPLVCDGAFSYSFTVVNAEDSERALECSVYESAVVVEPLMFHRGDVLSDLWHPIVQYHPDPPARVLPQPAMLARINEDSPEGGAIYRDIGLDSGEYAVWARLIEVADPIETQRAQLHFALATLAAPGAPGPFSVIGTTDGRSSSGRHGWTWRRIGKLRHQGGPARLRITALNRHRLAEAYFDLGRVAFVPEGFPHETEQPPLRLAPREQQCVVLSSRLGERPATRVDIELRDPANDESRRIFFHVRHRTAAKDTL
mgnify:CR=1 FL=1